LTPLIEVRDLSHIYSTGTPFQHIAIEHIDLSVARGQTVGIIGRTGSGKSTLIQHLNGLLRPTSGQVLVDGKDIWKDKATTRQTRFRVGLVFQYPEYQLFEETVFRDIAFGPKNMGLDEQEVRRRVEQAAAFVGVPERVLSASPFDLSGGQRRRVAIAGVIAMEPDVLVLDEPTAGLDPAGREALLQNLSDYRKSRNASLLMVSHSMEEVAALADRLIVMNEGHIVMDAAPGVVFSQAEALSRIGLAVPQVTEVFLRLRELGIRLDPAVYTVEQAVQAILSRKGGGRDA
jgi:energy-coupling factor transport system ATP-binding protein